MSGKVSYELEVNVAATEAWELYGTLELAKLVEKESEDFEEIEVIEGDGGVGTILHLKFTPGTSSGYPPSSFKEKFIKIDNENRVKVSEALEGGYLDVGFTLFRIILEIIEKGSDSCIIKSTAEFQLKEEATANASFFSIEMQVKIAEIAKSFLINKKKAKARA